MTSADGRPLRLSTFRYDTTGALLDGRVGVEGFATDVREPASISELFERMLVGHEFDIAELGLTYYLRTLDHGAPFVALPVFPARAFRHASVWVRADGDVQGPADLARPGRSLGEFGMYGQDAGVWIKGILSDEYGVDAAAARWVIGGLDAPAEPFSFAPPPADPSLAIVPAQLHAGLAQALADGEVDALFTSNVPQSVLDGSTAIRPLFSDAEQSERDYYRRTGIFPMMHTVVVRRELAEARPGLVRAVFDAFTVAKNAGAERYLQGRRLYEVTTMVPWMRGLVERNRELLGDDWWPYGFGANRTALDTVLRYHHEQGITSVRRTPEDVFAAELLDT